VVECVSGGVCQWWSVSVVECVSGGVCQWWSVSVRWVKDMERYFNSLFYPSHSSTLESAAYPAPPPYD